ncbi:hypothetical protein D9619_007199 [Psilocybe cf. subviscida]|uniref:Transmembrane protein n=1 Tax=Psilocybe cf. subviscida TaxID=2480587 RepID=A0A8H5EWJ1_9AGAR|nr:hypothetical protein D9619_007199 [Psilocybe cf. subviscida]
MAASKLVRPRHPDLQEVEEDLEFGPPRHLPETEGAGGDDESVPCCDGEGADEEVLVRRQVWGEVELVGELQGGTTGGIHGGGREGGRRGRVGRRWRQSLATYIAGRRTTMATPTANLDAGPILAPTESPSSTSTADPAFTGTSSDAAKQNTKMSNLYLVTFLATLFILLLISGAIVMRSYFLRRRYQRRLEEALASGLVLAPRAQGGKRKRFGAKPGLFEVYVREPTRPTESGRGDAKYGPPSVGEKDTLLEKDPLGVVGGGGSSLQWGSWGTILPLSAQPIFVKRKYRGIAETSSSSPGRLININNIIDPDFQSADGGLSTRPPPSRFLNLFGIDSEAYSIAYVSAQHARETQRRTDAQAGAASRMRRFERTVFDAWGISGARRARRAATADANAHPNADTAPTAEPAHAPPSPGMTSTAAATAEQRANYDQEAARMQDHLAVFGVGWNPPPVPRPSPEENGTHVVGVPVPLPTPGEDSDSENEDESGPNAMVGGRAVRGQRPRSSRTTEQGVVLDAEFGVNSAGRAAAAVTPGTAAAAPAIVPRPASSAPALMYSLPSTPEAAIPQAPSAPTVEAPQDTTVASPPAPATPPVKIRVEMLQIAVLIAMPTPHRKCRASSSKPKTVSPPTPAPTKATTGTTTGRRPLSLDEDLDEVSVKSSSTDAEYIDCAESLDAENKGEESDEDDGDRPMPEVVLGVSRVQYQHPPTLNANSSGCVQVQAINANANVDEDDMLGVTASGTRVAMTLSTTVRRPAAAARGGSLGGSAAFGIPG